VCGSGGQAFNGSCYYVASTESKWSTQHDLCYDKDHRSLLATIQSEEHDNFANSLPGKVNLTLIWKQVLQHIT